MSGRPDELDIRVQIDWAIIELKVRKSQKIFFLVFNSFKKRTNFFSQFLPYLLKSGQIKKKSSNVCLFDKIKCFRVMDEEGNIINPGYDKTIPDETLLKMYDTMVTMNETDSVYNAA